MNAIQFTLLIKDKIITSIYTGDEHGCRCGCHGRYFKPGEKGFIRALNKAKDLDPIVEVYDWMESAGEKACNEQVRNEFNGLVHAVGQTGPSTDRETWVDISRGNGKTITIYYKAA